MTRKKRTAAQMQSIIKEAMKNFKIWESSRNDRTEEFRQCKSIKYWFVSDKTPGTVISFYKSTEPKYLAINHNKSGRAFVVSGRGKNSKTHYIHRLQAEAFPDRVYRYGKAKNYKTLDGLEVHHIRGYKENNPDYEEVLEPVTHDKLFNRKTIPNICDDESKHLEYMQRVSKIAEENTPDQAVIVFSGTGIVNGVEVKDQDQAIYADDFPGVKEIVNQAIEKFKQPHPTVYEEEGYVVLYPGTLYTHNMMKIYHKGIIEHIKKADLQEVMEYDTTIADGKNKFDILVTKKK